MYGNTVMITAAGKEIISLAVRIHSTIPRISAWYSDQGYVVDDSMIRLGSVERPVHICSIGSILGGAGSILFINTIPRHSVFGIYSKNTLLAATQIVSSDARGCFIKLPTIPAIVLNVILNDTGRIKY